MKKIQVKQELCTGCRLCEAVCSLFREGAMDLTLSRIQIDPSSENSYKPRICIQCHQCPPSEVCPKGAFQWNERTGVVKIIKEECDGCGLCISECPSASILKRDGAVQVCDLCDGNPGCVEVCQKQAILFA